MRGLFAAELVLRFVALAIVANQIEVVIRLVAGLLHSLFEQLVLTAPGVEGALAVLEQFGPLALDVSSLWLVAPLVIACVLWFGRRRLARVALRVVFVEDNRQPIEGYPS